jgi:hypothetical protein
MSGAASSNIKTEQQPDGIIRQNDREIESILKSAPHHSINA